MASVVRLQERIALMMDAGASLDRIEMEVLEDSGLREDQKAALWLYAWSSMTGTEEFNRARHSVASVRG